MDYLLSGSGEVNLSLQDMIECDMKTEFADSLDDGRLDSMADDDGLESPLAGLDAESLSGGELRDRTGLDRYGALSRDVDISALDKDSKSDDGSSWLRIVGMSASSIQNDNVGDVFQMVNPQTGLPVHVQNAASSSTSASPRSGEPATVATSHGPSQPPSPVRSTATTTTIRYVTAAATRAPLRTTATSTTATSAATTMIQRQLKNVATSTATQQQQQQLHSLQNSKLITQALSNGTAVTLSSVSYQQLLLQQQQQQQQQQQSSRTTSFVTQQLLNSNNNHLKPVTKANSDNAKIYPKPVYSYSCLIAMALKNSETGALPVSEIYSFMTENFPYFKTAPDGWKNSVRHNLSLNKCFEKIENPKATGSTRKGCLWALNPAKIGKMDEEIAKWRKKDLEAIQRSMAKPEVLEKLEKGNLSSHRQRHVLTNLNGHDQDVDGDGLNSVNNNLVSVAAAAPTLTSKPIIGDIQLSMIEIKPSENGVGHVPVKVKVEPIFTIRPESVDASGAVGCSLTAEDLSVLDSSLSLDPSLGDSGLQNSVWEELGADGISLDDISFLFGPSTSSSSSTVQTAKTGSSSASAKSPMVSLLTSNNTANGASGSHATVTSSGLSHRIYAQT